MSIHHIQLKVIRAFRRAKTALLDAFSAATAACRTVISKKYRQGYEVSRKTEAEYPHPTGDCAEIVPTIQAFHDAAVAEIVDRSQRANSSNLSMFIIVQYDYDADRIAFLDSLRSALTRAGLYVREFDPVNNPGHGTGALYPLMEKVSAENAVSLIFGLPRRAGKIRADDDFIHYLNIHRDTIVSSRIRMILMLRKRDAEQFIFSAGDLWDFRNVTFWLERPVSGGSSWMWERMETQISEMPVSEADSEEIREHIRSVRSLVGRTADVSEKANLFLGLSQWLSRRDAHRPASEAALEGLHLIEKEISKRRAELECFAGVSLYRLHEFIDAKKHLEKALSVYKNIETRDLEVEANTLYVLGDLRMSVSDLDGAGEAYQDALPIYREIKDRRREANTLWALGGLRKRVDDLDGAGEAYQSALHIYREIKDRRGEANTLYVLGDLRMRVSDLDGAGEAYQDALHIYREIKDRLGEASTLRSLGDYFRARGDYSEAVSYINEALTIHLEIQEFLGVSTDLRSLCRTRNSQEEFGSAVLLSEISIYIARAIQIQWNEALLLEDQGDAFQGMKHRNAEIAAKWLALQIFNQIQPAAGENIAQFFQHLEETMGAEAYHSLVEELEQNAEATRRQAVLAVWQTHPNDPLVQDIFARLPEKFTHCFE